MGTADCSGEETSTPLSNFGQSAICSGETCPYVVTRDYYNAFGLCDEDGGDYPYFYETALIMDRCLDLGDGTSGFGTCTTSNVDADLYEDAGCSGSPIDSNTQSDGDCVEIVTCSLWDNSSAANFMLATVYLVICASMA